MSRTFAHGPLRALLVAALLCVLAMRIVVPQGFMWANDADGAPRMVSCSGFGPMPTMPDIATKALAAQHHSDRGGHDGTTVEHACAFATASAAVDLVGAIHPNPASVAPDDVPVAAYRSARPGLGLAAPPPPKTGPPSLA